MTTEPSAHALAALERAHERCSGGCQGRSGRGQVDLRHLLPDERWSKPLPGQPAARIEPKMTREQRKAASKARRH